MTHLLRLTVFALAAGALVLPILAGLWETGRAAFGVLPAIGADRLTLDPWRQLAALPGFATSLRLTLVTGVGSTLVALILAAGAVAMLAGRGGGPARLIAPLLAAPHAALAIGVAFLIAPSGWIVRLVSPWATGWDRPPDLALVNDPWGGALMLGLLIKEVPFLMLVMASALGQLPLRATLATGRALGYGRATAWLRLILPRLYPLIRLPVYIVLAFALSVVDMAIILGPSTPPTLAVALTRWFGAADTALILPASAGAVLQAGLVVGGIALWRGAELMLARLGRAWLRRGARGRGAAALLAACGAAVAGLVTLGLLALAALAVWSLAWRWPFPAALPEAWSLRGWLRPADWGEALGTTLALGLASTALSLTLAITWLEAEDRAGRMPWSGALIYLPLLVPQIAFLYGLNVVMLRAGLSGGMGAVIWAQVLFVFPYVMLALADPWRALDRRLLATAAALGAGPVRRLLGVKLPVLARPILTAAAVGFAVSVAQYLPTLFMGAGRVTTLTTEAVTLSSGSDRRVVGLYGALQAMLPFLAYALALGLPAILHRNRRGLTGGLA